MNLPFPYNNSFEHLRARVPADYPANTWDPRLVTAEVYTAYLSYSEAWKHIKYEFSLRQFASDCLTTGSFSLADAKNVVIIAVFWAVLRLVLTKTILQSWSVNLFESNRTKFPETGFRLAAKLILCPANVYCCFFASYNIGQRPIYIYDILPHAEIPLDIYICYMLELGFYVQNIVLSWFLDDRKKDFYATLLHHVVTLGLVFFSYSTKYGVKSGVLILALHEPADIFLLIAKTATYFRRRKNCEFSKVLDNISIVCVACFAISWYWLRIWCFYCLVIRSTTFGVVINATVFPAPLHQFMVCMVFTLFGLNIFWGYVLLDFVMKVVQGKLTEVDDTRDKAEQTATKEKRVRSSSVMEYATQGSPVARLDSMLDLQAQAETKKLS